MPMAHDSSGATDLFFDTYGRGVGGGATVEYSRSRSRPVLLSGSQMGVLPLGISGRGPTTATAALVGQFSQPSPKLYRSSRRRSRAVPFSPPEHSAASASATVAASHGSPESFEGLLALLDARPSGKALPNIPSKKRKSNRTVSERRRHELSRHSRRGFVVQAEATGPLSHPVPEAELTIQQQEQCQEEIANLAKVEALGPWPDSSPLIPARVGEEDEAVSILNMAPITDAFQKDFTVSTGIHQTVTDDTMNNERKEKEVDVNSPTAEVPSHQHTSAVGIGLPVNLQVEQLSMPATATHREQVSAPLDQSSQKTVESPAFTHDELEGVTQVTTEPNSPERFAMAMMVPLTKKTEQLSSTAGGKPPTSVEETATKQNHAANLGENPVVSIEQQPSCPLKRITSTGVLSQDGGASPPPFVFSLPSDKVDADGVAHSTLLPTDGGYGSALSVLTNATIPPDFVSNNALLGGSNATALPTAMLPIRGDKQPSCTSAQPLPAAAAELANFLFEQTAGVSPSPLNDKPKDTMAASIALSNEKTASIEASVAPFVSPSTLSAPSTGEANNEKSDHEDREEKKLRELSPTRYVAAAGASKTAVSLLLSDNPFGCQPLTGISDLLQGGNEKGGVNTKGLGLTLGGLFSPTDGQGTDPLDGMCYDR